MSHATAQHTRLRSLGEIQMTMPPEVGVSSGLRVLVVEDSFLIAWSLRRMLNDLGCHVIGPASSVRGALDLLDSTECDAAILDVNLAGENSMPIASALSDMGTPFVFLTGYSSPATVELKFRSHIRLRKPLTESALRRVVIEQLSTPHIDPAPPPPRNTAPDPSVD